MKPNQLQRWVSILMAGLLGFAALPVVAQDDDEGEGVGQEIEQIVVVGSRIPVSTPKDGSSPVQIITAEEIASTGLTDLGSLLQELPGAGAALNLTFNNGGEGSTRLSFRNLGTARTLILVDGRRWVPGGTGANSSVDLNTIPVGMIETIEILKDGASSIYGADAIGAVVNVKLRKNFNGSTFSISQGEFMDGGGESKQIEALFGIDGDRGNVTFGLSWVNNQSVGNWERPETARPPFYRGSSFTPQGRFYYSDLSLPGLTNDDSYGDNDAFIEADYIEHKGVRKGGALGAPEAREGLTLAGTYASVKDALYAQKSNSDGTLTPTPVKYGSRSYFTIKDDNPNALIGAQPGDFAASGPPFNFNPYNYVVTPNERRSAVMRGNFDINDKHSATFKFLYQNRRSDQLLAPNPLTFGNAGQNSGMGISASNGFNNLQIEFCGTKGSSAYGARESCYQEASHYYMFGGNLMKTPAEFYKNGDMFGTGDSAAVKDHLYNRNADGDRTSAKFPVAASADCNAQGAPIGTNKDVAKCSRYSDAYLDKDGNLEYVVETMGIGINEATRLYRAVSDTRLEDNAVAAGTDIYQAFIDADVAKKDADGNVIYATETVVKPGHAVGLVRRRMLESGPRNFLQDIETFHAEAGVEGSFDVGTFEWRYDAAWSWSQVQSYVRAEGLTNMRNLSKALGPSAENADYVRAADNGTGDAGNIRRSDNEVTQAEADAYNTANDLSGDNAISPSRRYVVDANGNIACSDSTDGCVAFNIFGGQGTNAEYLGGGLWSGEGSITKEMLDYVTFTGQDAGDNTQKMVTANVAGNIVDLPAGRLGVAAGLEYRDIGGSYQPDSLITSGASSGNRRYPTSGSYDATEYYVEARIPIVGSLPGIQLLDATISARNSEFSGFGTTTSDKLAIGWEINDIFKLRATQSTGFRAPSASDLYGGARDSYPNLSDPCASTVGALLEPNEYYVGDDSEAFSQCAADGVPAGGINQVDAQIRITLATNPNLIPEESESFTYGIVIEPMDTMQITVDFWSIEIDDQFASWGAQNILDRCYEDKELEFCARISRGSDGSIADLINDTVNGGKIETKGYDIALAYDINDQWYVSADATYTEQMSFTDLYGKVEEWAGRISAGRGLSVPRVKGRIYTRFESEDGRWRWTNEMNYIHNVLDLNLPGWFTIFLPYNDPKGWRLDPIYYWDTAVRYDWERINTQFYLGIDNVLDEDPPYYPNTFANDFDPSYRVWGSQRWTVSVYHYID